MLAFNPERRPGMADVLRHPYFSGIANPKREPSADPIHPSEFAFETEQLSNLDIKELIYRRVVMGAGQGLLLRSFLAQG